MAYLGSWKIDDALTFYCNTHTPSTSGVVDADAVPGYRIYEDETGTPILTGSMSLLDDANTTGFYSEQVTLSAANGLEKGKCYCVRTTGVVGGVTAALVDTFQIEAEVDSNSVSNLNANVITAASIASAALTAAKFDADAITAAKVAADVGTEIATAVWAALTASNVAVGSFGQRLAGVRANTAQAGGATSITLDASASAVDDFYNDDLIVITAGTGAGQARVGEDYNGTTKVLTVKTWQTNPDATSVFVIIPQNSNSTALISTSEYEAKGSIGINSAGTARVQVWLEDGAKAILNATALTIDILDQDQSSIIANADWTTAPTENADNTWYAVKTGASGSFTAGEAFRIKCVFTVSGTNYTRYIPFNAAL